MRVETLILKTFRIFMHASLVFKRGFVLDGQGAPSGLRIGGPAKVELGKDGCPAPILEGVPRRGGGSSGFLGGLTVVLEVV